MASRSNPLDGRLFRDVMLHITCAMYFSATGLSTYWPPSPAPCLYRNHFRAWEMMHTNVSSIWKLIRVPSSLQKKLLLIDNVKMLVLFMLVPACDHGKGEYHLLPVVRDILFPIISRTYRYTTVTCPHNVSRASSLVLPFGDQLRPFLTSSRLNSSESRMQLQLYFRPARDTFSPRWMRILVLCMSTINAQLTLVIDTSHSSSNCLLSHSSVLIVTYTYLYTSAEVAHTIMGTIREHEE